MMAPKRVRAKRLVASILRPTSGTHDTVVVGAADGDAAEAEHVPHSHLAQRPTAVAAQSICGAAADHLPGFVANQTAHHGDLTGSKIPDGI